MQKMPNFFTTLMKVTLQIPITKDSQASFHTTQAHPTPISITPTTFKVNMQRPNKLSILEVLMCSMSRLSLHSSHTRIHTKLAITMKIRFSMAIRMSMEALPTTHMMVLTIITSTQSTISTISLLSMGSHCRCQTLTPSQSIPTTIQRI